MSLPRFIDRVADALTLAAPAADRADLITHLGTLVVDVRLSGRPDSAPGDLTGRTSTEPPPGSAALNLAATLLARLYPTFRLSGDPQAQGAFAREVTLVNPDAEVISDPADTEPPAGLIEMRVAAGPAVVVDVHGWHVLLDDPRRPTGAPAPAATPLISLAAVNLGCATLFRTAFVGFLPNGRSVAEPSTLNLLTLQPWTDGCPDVPPQLEIGEVHLAGAGAIGQAACLALAAHSRDLGLTGHITIVDHEQITLSNLQRYVLTHDRDVDATKAVVAADHLRAAGLPADPAVERWGTSKRSAPGQQTVLVALDSAADRVGVAAGTHHRIYNAYTGTEDLGWSRHEAPSAGSDGTDPCLACLYWPTQPRPHRHEQVADALGIHPLRALAYLVTRTPIGAPLADLSPIANLNPPTEASSWLTQGLLADLQGRDLVTQELVDAWTAQDMDTLYRDGVCGGAIVKLSRPSGTAHVIVPSAHQSALAGTMLALQLVVAVSPALVAYRPKAVEGRLDVLRPLPAIVPRPRQRTPDCICQDPDYER